MEHGGREARGGEGRERRKGKKEEGNEKERGEISKFSWLSVATNITTCMAKIL